MPVYSRQTAPVFRDGRNRPVPQPRSAPAKRPPEPSEAPQETVVARPQEDASANTGMPIIALLFLMSLLVPIVLTLGPIVLLPFRIVLLLAFVPLFFKWVGGQAGKANIIDWLVFGSALWAALALAANHPIGSIIEPAGINTAEVFGAYLVGRMAVRSSEDFMKVVKFLFLALVCLLPFAIIEAVTDRNILLSIIPSSTPDGNQGVRFGINRAQVVFAHSIHYGVFSCATFGMVWYAYRPDFPLLRYIMTGPITAISTGLSLSTGALIAFNIQIILIVWEMVTKPNPKRWAIFGWLALAGYIIVDIFAARSPFHTIVAKLAFSTQSAYTRLLIFEYGMNNVRDNPILGLGLNDWVRPNFLAASTDNFWLLITMRFGVPCFVMLAIAVFLIMRRAGRAPLTDPMDRACRAAFLTTMGGLIIAGGTVDYWKAMLAFFMFLLGTGVWTFTGGARTAPAEEGDDVEEDTDTDRARRSSPPRQQRGQVRRT